MKKLSKLKCNRLGWKDHRDRRNVMSNLRKNGKIVTWYKFRDKFKNCILKNFRHAEGVVCIATDTEDPNTDFEERHMHE